MSTIRPFPDPYPPTFGTELHRISMKSASHRRRSVLAQASAAQLCLSLIVGCAVAERPGEKSSPASKASTQDLDAGIDSSVAPRGAGMPNAPIHRADAGARASTDAMAASPQPWAHGRE